MKSFLVLLSAMLPLAVPAAALGSPSDVDLTSTNQTVVINARGSERNMVSVTTDSAAAPTVLLVTDAGAGVDTDDPLCAVSSPGVVSCPIASVTRVDVNAGNLDDITFIDPQVPASIRATPDGGSGNDSLVGGAGNDTLTGGSGDDALYGRDGNDLLTGNTGNDFLSGEAGADSLNGSENNDLLDGGPGADSMAGGASTDTVSYAARFNGVLASIGGFPGGDGGAEDGPAGAADTIALDVENLAGGAGADSLAGDDDPNQIFGNGGDDIISGNAQGDGLFGQDGRDLVLGGDGNDLVKGGSGRDRMFGGFGNDLLKARDGGRDKRLNCGGGRQDRLKSDKRDPHGKSCT